MFIENTKTNGLVRELKIDIVKEDYSEKVEKELKDYRRKVSIPGFRQGNAPMGLIRKNYYKALLADSVNKLVYESVDKYIKENTLEIMFEPIPVNEQSKIDFEKDETFTFVFEMAEKPKFELNLSQLPAVEYFHIIADEKDIDTAIEQKRKEYGSYINYEEIDVNLPLYISVSYPKSCIEKHESENKDAQSQDVHEYIQTENLSEKGKEVLNGKKVGEEIEISAIEIFTNKADAAKFLNLKEEELDVKQAYENTVKIDRIGGMKPAELDEDFFKKTDPSGAITDEKTFRNFVKTQIEKELEIYSNNHFGGDAIETIINNTTIELPADFIKRYLLLTQDQLNQENIDEEYAKGEKAFKWQLIENKLVEKYSFSVSRDDIKNYVKDFYIKNYFQYMNPEDVVKHIDSLIEKTMQDKEQVNKIYDQLFDLKINQLFKENIPLKEQSGDFSAFSEYLQKKKENTEKKKEEKTEKLKKTGTSKKQEVVEIPFSEEGVEPKQKKGRAKKAE